MANNKKIFTIEINGLSESVKSVGALQEKIDALNKSLKGMGKTKIKIGEGSADAEYNKLLADRQKQLAAVNKELQQTGKNVKEYKQETKELVALEEKARNETKGYAHTLAGLKQELKDLKAASQNINYGSDQYVKMSEEIFAITKQLKDLEEAQGTFGRNVGNYKSAVEYLEEMDKKAETVKKRAQELPVIWEKLKSTIDSGGKISSKDIIGTVSFNELKQELDSLKKAMDDAVGEDEYNSLKKYYDQLKVVGDEYKRLRGEAVKADNQLKTQLQRTINGQTYTWENLTAAVGELEDKLYQLAADGRRNTQEFKNIAKAAAELKTELRQVDYEIDGMSESSLGITKMVSRFQSFTALFQGAQGISQLFGMDSENAMKGIQTMAALQGVASALQTIQEQMRRDPEFAKMMDSWIKKLSVLSVGFGNLNKILSKFDKLTSENEGTQHFLNAITDLNNAQMEAIYSSRGMLKEYKAIVQEIEKLGGKVTLPGETGLLTGVRRLDGVEGVDPQRLEEIRARIDSLGESLNNFGNTNFWTKIKANINALADNLGLISSTAPQAASGIQKLGNAIKFVGKSLKYLIAATVVLLLVQAFLELVGAISEAIGKLYTFIAGNDKLVNSLNKVETEVDLVNKALDRYNSKLSTLKNSGVIDDIDELALRYEKLQIEILKSAKALQDFVKARKDAKSLEEGTKDDDYTFFGKASDIEDIDDATERLKRFREVYFELQAAVEAGNDETGKRGKGWYNFDIFNWFTSSDAKADFGEMQKQVIKDLQYQINNLDLSKGSDELKRFYELLQDPMYASAIANVENLYPEEEWTQVLKKRLEQVQSMYEQITETAKESAEAELAYNEKLYEQRIQRLESENERRRRVRNNLTEAIEDEYERELQALYNAQADEIEAARKQGAEMLKLNADKVDVEKAVQEEISSINKKYNRLEMDMLKKHQEDKLKELEESEWDITEILRRIRDNRLSAEEESLDKHLQEIENERKDALEDAAKEAEEAAKEGHNLTELYNELALSINIKYDALIKKEKEQYYQDLLDMYEDYERAMQEVQMQYRANNLDNKSSDVDINYNDKLNSSSGSFDFSAKYGKLIQEEKKFNQERLKIELDYLEDKKKLDEEYAKFEKDDATNQEVIRYEDALKNLKKTKEEGKLTIEEYNSMIEREEELHMQQMTMIDSKYNNDLTTINNQYLKERK